MPISQLQQFSYLTAKLIAHKQGSESSGTGFFFNFSINDGEVHFPCIVTNKHVVDGSTSGVIFFHAADEAGDPVPGAPIACTVNDFGVSFIRHPDEAVDLAVLPVGTLIEQIGRAGRKIFYKGFRRSDVADAAFLDSLGPMETITMIGYPIGLWDSKNNFPITRQGITATPAYVDFEGRPEFLIDCACFPGSSGSPVMLANFGSYVDRDGNTHMGTHRFKLLGVLWGGPQYNARGEIRARPVPTQSGLVSESLIPTNLGFCVKATQLDWFQSHFESANIDIIQAW